MSKITILHLSDIHFKKKQKEENKTFHKVVQHQLIESVKSHSTEHGHPDFVVITGDIAFSGNKHEYDEALEFFDGLKAVLPGETEFLAVPGNHDVDRDKKDEFFSLRKHIVQEGLTDKFLEDQKKIKDFIDVKFKAYRRFIDRLNPSLYESKKKKKDKAKEKENYFWVKNVDDKGVSFLGLNSAWASEGDNDRFQIALGFPQVHHALEQSKEIPNRIVLMHHPLFDWLEEKEQIEAFIHNWFRAVSGQAEGLAAVTAAEMVGDIRFNEPVEVFTRNPLLLTAVCILYLDNQRLPDQRAELYCRIVDNLVYRRFSHLKEDERVRIEDYLKLLAFNMQEGSLKTIETGPAKKLLKIFF